jgi:Zn-dependent protease with chaperone function
MMQYRYANETLILIGTLLLIGVALLLTSVPTLCLSPLLVLVLVLFAGQANRAHHQQLMQMAQPVTPQTLPGLAAIVEECRARLRVGPVQTYVIRHRELNAYTFGLADPNVIVLHSALFDVMDADEMRFIIGHELGHVALGHTWLNTLVGGMAGVPMPAGAALILVFIFRWWNRACEYSADRAGLIACGSLNKSISALVQLVAGDVNTQAELQRALAMIEQQDDSLGNVLAESLATHPMIVRRIEKLRQYAASAEYRRLMQSL